MAAVALTEHDIPAGAGTVHVVEAGDPKGRPVALLHGYPESWHEWSRVIELAAAEPAGAIAPDVGVRVIALDLPGIGQSVSAPTDGRKSAIAEVVHEVVERLGLDRPLIVGHDAGGMVAYAYLRAYAEEVSGVVIMDVVIPGLPPWEEVLANPHVWHFAFHAIPELPEHLVRGKQREYFDYFWGATTANPDGITPTLRAAHAVAYADDRALTAGFDLYRAMRADAEENTATAGGPAVDTPLLYLRGEHEGGDMDAYVGGFHGAGIRNVDDARVSGSGHYAPEESPEAVWSLIRDFARRH